MRPLRLLQGGRRLVNETAPTPDEPEEDFIHPRERIVTGTITMTAAQWDYTIQAILNECERRCPNNTEDEIAKAYHEMEPIWRHVFGAYRRGDEQRAAGA